MKLSKEQASLLHTWQKTPSRLIVRLPGGYWVIADGVNCPTVDPKNKNWWGSIPPGGLPL